MEKGSCVYSPPDYLQDWNYHYTLLCDNEEEADSAKCAHNPSAEGCAVESDTTLFACTDNISGNGALYRLACRAKDGVVVSCNGKTSVDIATDGTKIRDLRGTCAENGFGTGVIGGSNTPQDSTPQSANADCFAVIGSKCHMKDKVSGNTFTCDCDGSCNVALRNLMAGNANCTNPYPQPTSSSDSLILNIASSSSSSPESSEGGSSGGTSSGGEGNSSDWEIDYTEILNDIKANTQQGNNYLENISNNTYTANSLLQAIVNKDWTPTINVAAPNVNVAGDTNIINVEVQGGDTSRAPSQILALMQDGQGNASDTAGSGVSLQGYLDGIDSIVGAGVPDMSDSMPFAIHHYGETIRAYGDSINALYGDSIQAWKNTFLNNGVLTGNGSDDCPSILTDNWTYEFPMFGNTIRVEAGSLGTYLCSPISPFNVSLWKLARILLRALVSIACMWWLFKEALGMTGGSNDED